MSDTKETESYTTVELTLDNDEIIECAILTVYEAAGKEYIALLPLDEMCIRDRIQILRCFFNTVIFDP